MSELLRISHVFVNSLLSRSQSFFSLHYCVSMYLPSSQCNLTYSTYLRTYVCVKKSVKND